MKTRKKKIVSTKLPTHLFNLLFAIAPSDAPCSLVSDENKDTHTLLLKDQTNQRLYILSIKPFTKELFEKETHE